jgi:monofunctional biosynthetic peptidoglycan transglycosylase
MPNRSVWSRASRLILRVAVGVILLSILSVIAYRFVAPPVTPLMLIRAAGGSPIHKIWRSFDAISPEIFSAVIAAEDDGFCAHHGFDWTAMNRAWEADRQGQRLRGGSTISQQTAKNLFLWPARNFLRKGLEAYFTFLMESLMGKTRIALLYVNDIEWGDGIYGVEAAAEASFHKPAKALSAREAALLAAVLPNPRRWSAARPTGYILARAQTIEARMRPLPRSGGVCE